MSKNTTQNIGLDTMDKTKKTANERLQKQKELERNVCINRWAWALLVIGLFVLCTAMLGTILAWTPRSTDRDLPTTDIIINNTDQGNIDINLIIKDKHYLKSSDVGDKLCTSINCDMTCKHTSSLYRDIKNGISGFRCKNMHKLVVKEQTFIDNQDIEVLNDINMTVGSVSFESTKIYRPEHIFNNDFFAKTTSLMLLNCEFETTTDNLLIGLKSLTAIQIIGNFGKIEDNFFTAVNSTLHYIVLNAQMSIYGTRSLFGNVDMSFLIELNLNFNNIVGALNKMFLIGAPNLKYLYLQNCFITIVTLDFFDSLSDKLVFLDLSHNHIKSLGEQDYSVRYTNAIINLNYNQWICTCTEYKILSEFFTEKNIIIEGPFCASPFDMQDLCYNSLASHCKNMNSKEIIFDVSSTRNSPITLDELEVENTEITTTTLMPASDSKSHMPTTLADEESTNMNITSTDKEYSFALELQSNQTVKVIVHMYDCSDMLNIIWFATLKSEAEVLEPISYRCSQYMDPYLVTCPLKPDTTYTFCVVSSKETSTSLINCLPFYMPPLTEDPDIWIPEEYKDFTLCLIAGILMFSMFLGSLIAYCAIKMWPSMLKGSKKVVMVKSDDKKRISTISNFVEKHNDNNTTTFQRSVSSTIERPKKRSLTTQASVSLCAFCKGDDYEIPVCSCHQPAPLPPPLPQRNSNASSNS